MEITDLRIDLQNNKKFKNAIKTILEEIGEDVNRDGLKRTPLRVAKAFEEWVGGYAIKRPDLVLDRVFESNYDEMVIEKNIQFFSLCEHHLSPFFGEVHIAYIPKGYIIGLDKLIKLVEVYSRRLQTQEELTHQIVMAIDKALDPIGTGVQIEAFHFCISSRGTRNQTAKTVTTKLTGGMKTPDAKAEFLKALEK